MAGLNESGIARLKDDSDNGIDKQLYERMKSDHQFWWAARQGIWSFGVSRPRDFLLAALSYNLRDGIAARTKVPVLVGRAESDQFFAGQPGELVQHLTQGKPELVDFRDRDGAGGHAQVGASRLLGAIVGDWLLDVFTAAHK